MDNFTQKLKLQLKALEASPWVKFLIHLPIFNFIYGQLVCARVHYLFTNHKRLETALREAKGGPSPRVAETVSCPDNAFIHRAAEAGKLENAIITMHNGVRVYALSYYGTLGVDLLMRNKGAHEPQEERAFTELLPYLPQNSVMLELGSYWAFYSLSLLHKLTDATCHLVEPVYANLVAGKMNFKLNGKKGHFEQAFVDDNDSLSLTGTRTISVDGYCARHRIGHLNLLHSDIQGYEVKMLRGAKRMLGENRVDYLFISTHSNALHHDCLKILEDHKYKILAEADLDNTYSVDGLIVAKRANLGSGPDVLEIAHKVVPEKSQTS